MSHYTSGTATGAGAATSLFNANDTHIRNNGWTQHDVIAATDVLYKGTELTSGIGNAPFVRVTVTSTTAIDIRVYQDWDTSTHTGISAAGNATGNSRLAVQDASFSYFIRANPVAFMICAKIGANYNKQYGGFLRRGLSLGQSGITKTTQAYASGVATMNVASDLRTTLQVGQVVQLLNYAHNSASANAANVEKMTIQSIAASSITFTGNTTKAYDSGALIGQNVYPIVVVNNGTGAQAGMTVNLLTITEIDGTRTSATAHTVGSAEALIQTVANDAPSSGWGQYGSGIYSCAATTASKTGLRGYYYHVYAPLKNAQNAEDIMTDGVNTFIVLGIGTSLVTTMGPQN